MTWEISDNLIKIIRKIIPEGSRILELGSGEGTKELRKYFEVISIEHDINFVNKLKDDFPKNEIIHAPLKKIKPTKEFPLADQWYDLPLFITDYDLLLIDGPIGKNRAGLWKYQDRFNWNIPVIFDDTNRESEWKLCTLIARKYKYPQILTLDSDTRPSFSVLADKEIIKKLL